MVQTRLGLSAQDFCKSSLKKLIASGFQHLSIRSSLEKKFSFQVERMEYLKLGTWQEQQQTLCF